MATLRKSATLGITRSHNGSLVTDIAVQTEYPDFARS
jgi:hypothetical protein